MAISLMTSAICFVLLFFPSFSLVFYVSLSYISLSCLRRSVQLHTNNLFNSFVLRSHTGTVVGVSCKILCQCLSLRFNSHKIKRQFFLLYFLFPVYDYFFFYLLFLCTTYRQLCCLTMFIMNYFLSQFSFLSFADLIFLFHFIDMRLDVEAI